MCIRDRNTEFVGEWEVLDIQLSEDGIEEMETNYEMLEIEEIRSLIKPRKQFADVYKRQHQQRSDMNSFGIACT